MAHGDHEPELVALHQHDPRVGTAVVGLELDAAWRAGSVAEPLNRQRFHGRPSLPLSWGDRVHGIAEEIAYEIVDGHSASTTQPMITPAAAAAIPRRVESLLSTRRM